MHNTKCSKGSRETEPARLRKYAVKKKSVSEKEERIIRRRQQYRLHQQRHRAKLKFSIGYLERAISALTVDVGRMELYHDKLLNQRAIVPQRITAAFFEVFKFGYRYEEATTIESFLNLNLTEDVEISNMHGIDAFISQWKTYARCFDEYRLSAQGMCVECCGKDRLVFVDANIQLRAKREGVLQLYPNLVGQEFWIQKMMRTLLKVPVRFIFHFDLTGKLYKILVDGNYILALQEFAGSVEHLGHILSNVQFSTVTGTIQESAENSRLPDARMDIEFLLT